MIKKIQRELIYSFYTFIPLIMITVIMMLISLNYFNLYKSAIANYDLYKKTEAIHLNQGLNIEEELKKEPNIYIDNDGVEVLENVLSYDYKNLVSSINELRPINNISISLKWLTFIFFPLIFTLYGINIGTYDYFYKTIKIKIVHNKWKDVFIGKLLAIYLMTIIIFIVTIFSSIIISNIVFGILKNNIPIHGYIDNSSFDMLSFIKMSILSLTVCLLYGTIGLCIGIIFKSPLIPSLLFVGYNFFLPILFSGDLRNLISTFGHRAFHFDNDGFKLFQPIEISISHSILLLLIYYFVLLFGSFIISNKQIKHIK